MRLWSILLVSACRNFSWAVSDLGYDRRTNLGTLHWEHRVSVTGPPAKSSLSLFCYILHFQCHRHPLLTLLPRPVHQKVLRSQLFAVYLIKWMEEKKEKMLFRRKWSNCRLIQLCVGERGWRWEHANPTFYFIFWLYCTACGILVPQPGIEPVSPAVEAQSLNHWTARKPSNATF